METSSFQYDPAFMEAFRRGENWCFRVVFDSTVGQLKGWLWNKWGGIPLDKREDFISISYYNLFKAREKIKDFEHIRRTLFFSLQNLIKDDWRRQSRASPHKELFSWLAYEVDTINTDGHEDYIGMMRAAIKKLPARKKQIVMMCFYEEKSISQIADELGLDAQTVRNLRSRAVNILRKLLPFAGKKTNEYIWI